LHTIDRYQTGNVALSDGTIVIGQNDKLHIHKIGNECDWHNTIRLRSLVEISVDLAVQNICFLNKDLIQVNAFPAGRKKNGTGKVIRAV